MKISNGDASQAFMTRMEVAERLRISTRTLDGFIKSGKLKCLKVGRQLRFTSKMIEDFEDCCFQPETDK
jgi:excisionase family DNA binding protein